MQFKSKKESTCFNCGKPIHIGDWINWQRFGINKGRAWHVVCPTITTDTETKIETKMEEKMNTQSINSSTDAEKIGKMFLEMMNRNNQAQVSTEEIKNLIADEVKKVSIPRTVEIKASDAPSVNVGLVHAQFDKLLKIVSMRDASGNRMNAFLHGDAGSGKSKGASQVAKALGLEYGFVSLNPQSPESRLIGYMNASGNYVETEFVKRYINGGVFCIDEVDNSSTQLLATLNSLLENGHGAFPHGVFPRHKDFVCICTANTNGRGGSIFYPDRRALCSTFLDRFVFLKWDYDYKLIKAILDGILDGNSDEFFQFVNEKKDELQSRHPSLIVSPRAYIQGAIMKKNGFGSDEILNAVIARGM